MIEVTDNFLTEDDCYSVVDYCNMASYSYGETDYPGSVSYTHLTLPTNREV